MKSYLTNNSIKTVAKFFALATMIGSFALAAFAAVPPNDNFANAKVVSGIEVHTVSENGLATKEPGEPNHAGNIGGKSVWYRWTAPMTRTMSITTNRSVGNLDTLLNVYQGTALNNLSSEIFNNNINSPSNLRSFVRFTAIQGTTYYIAVDGNNTDGQIAEGIFELDIQPSFNFQGADYDSDGITDFSYFRPSDGSWNVINSSSQQITKTFWGTNGDIPVQYSYSANGQNNFNVYRPSQGILYTHPLDCCNTNSYINWGTAGDIPVTANYGGDANTDFAVFRPSNGTWYINYGQNNYTYYRFGQAGDIPLPGQYSNDSHADICVFRPTDGVWYFIKRVNNNPGLDTFSAVKFGQQDDKPVPADYDGDGILDVAIYRPSTGVWWILRSSDNQAQAVKFGIAEDVPTTGDYDGDGKFDFAVFRPSTGVWYVLRSSDSEVQSKQFGQAGDIPVTANPTF